jgi:hypothetical protein
MPVDLEIAQEKGWDRNAEHSGIDPIYVMHFRDAASGKILFTYGAKFTDITIWVKYFSQLGEYEKSKKIRADSNMAEASGNDSGRCSQT